MKSLKTEVDAGAYRWYQMLEAGKTEGQSSVMAICTLRSSAERLPPTDYWTDAIDVLLVSGGSAHEFQQPGITDGAPLETP